MVLGWQVSYPIVFLGPEFADNTQSNLSFWILLLKMTERPLPTPTPLLNHSSCSGRIYGNNLVLSFLVKITIQLCFSVIIPKPSWLILVISTQYWGHRLCLGIFLRLIKKYFETYWVQVLFSFFQNFSISFSTDV